MRYATGFPPSWAHLNPDGKLGQVVCRVATAGFYAFRHFNVSLMDALRVPLKTIQERLGHALTGSFTLDVYGGKPEPARNLEAARQLSAEIERAVTAREQENKAASVDYSDSLTAVDENGSGVAIS